MRSLNQNFPCPPWLFRLNSRWFNKNQCSMTKIPEGLRLTNKWYYIGTLFRTGWLSVSPRCFRRNIEFAIQINFISVSLYKEIQSKILNMTEWRCWENYTNVSFIQEIWSEDHILSQLTWSCVSWLTLYYGGLNIVSNFLMYTLFL